MIRIENLSRRDVLKGAAASSLILGIYIGPGAAEGAEEAKEKEAAAGGSFTPNVYITLESSGALNITVPLAEMGQAVRTTLPMIVADEMAASWQKVVVKQAEGDPKYGDQSTDGSHSIRTFYTPLRQAGAAARDMLEAAAALTWKAAIRDCRAVDHVVIHLPTGRTLPFGALAKAAASLPVPPPSRLRLKDASSRRYVGHPVPSVDLVAMLKGRAIYGIDVAFPGLKHASIERPPVYGGKVKSFDAAAAMTVKGVEKIIEIPASPVPTGHLPLGGVAVIANNTWSALQGRKKLNVQWDLGPNASHDSAAYKEELLGIVRKPCRQVRNAGLVDANLTLAPKKVNAEYFVPYYAHATMEPPSATAGLEKGVMQIVAPTQDPQDARKVLAGFLGMKETEIVVRPTLIGSGLGRKSNHDFICEAAWLARALSAPVKVTWSREDDMRHGYYYPMTAQKVDGGVDKEDVPVAWRHRSVFPSLESTFKPNITQINNAQLAQGLTDVPYLIPHLRCEAGSTQNSVRVGWHPSAMNVSHAFATSSFIDEMATAASKDAGNFVYTYLAGPRKIDFKALGVDFPNDGAPIDDYPFDVGRLQSVLQLAMNRAGWGDPLLPRQGRGLAVHRSFCSYVAAVAVVQVAQDGTVIVPRIDLAIDCGTTIHPERVRAILEGAVMYGISLTLRSQLTIKNGTAVETNFDTYKVARIGDTPDTHIYIASSNASPGGVSAPAIPVIAPAICNAIFAATGKRVRALPVNPNDLKT